MRQPIIAIGTTLTALVVAGCGAVASSSSPTSPSTGNAAASSPAGRSGASGELVQINGHNIVLNGQNGDVTIGFGTATTIQKTRTGTVADILPGTCVVVTGQKDAGGALAATMVRLSQPIGGACGAGLGPGGPGAARGNGGAPNGAGGGPGGLPSNIGFVRGKVATVTGTSVTVQPTSGDPQTVTVPTTVIVTSSAPAAVADLAVGDCVRATGAKDSAGAVTATSLSIVPAGPSGCFTGGGGGRFRGGAGGGAGAAGADAGGAGAGAGT